MNLQLDCSNLKGFVSDEEINGLLSAVAAAHKQLHDRTGKGSDFLGWLDLPSKTSDKFLKELDALGKAVRANSDCLVSIGIGGSYIGIRSSLDFMSAKQKLPVYYAGHNLSAGYLAWLLKTLEKKRVTVVVISKSGTTTEPALAFRVLKKFMEDKYGKKGAAKRIIAITDEKKGALRGIANKEGYRSFVIGDDVGGRFSVMSPVGLVPLAIAGVDVKAMIAGAREAEKAYAEMDLAANPAYRYAAIRYLLSQKGKKIEVLATFNQRIAFVAEWWKQLYGESEGKEGKGIFPASVNYTADLHSMGQLMQQGERNIFETFLQIENTGYKLKLPKDTDNLDNFNCVAGKDLDFVNKQAYKATAMAHYEGGVPNLTITLPSYDAQSLGALYYFFEKAVGMSGYLLGVNPFDQPGVEAYKSKMFALLGRK